MNHQRLPAVLCVLGLLILSTINRTPKALLFAIIGGEYILRLLPKGTHTYEKLIRPQELKDWSQRNGLEFSRIASLKWRRSRERNFGITSRR